MTRSSRPKRDAAGAATDPSQSARRPSAEAPGRPGVGGTSPGGALSAGRPAHTVPGAGTPGEDDPSQDPSQVFVDLWRTEMHGLAHSPLAILAILAPLAVVGVLRLGLASALASTALGADASALLLGMCLSVGLTGAATLATDLCGAGLAHPVDPVVARRRSAGRASSGEPQVPQGSLAPLASPTQRALCRLMVAEVTVTLAAAGCYLFAVTDASRFFPYLLAAIVGALPALVAITAARQAAVNAGGERRRVVTLGCALACMVPVVGVAGPLAQALCCVAPTGALGLIGVAAYLRTSLGAPTVLAAACSYALWLVASIVALVKALRS